MFTSWALEWSHTRVLQIFSRIPRDWCSQTLGALRVSWAPSDFTESVAVSVFMTTPLPPQQPPTMSSSARLTRSHKYVKYRPRFRTGESTVCLPRVSGLLWFIHLGRPRTTVDCQGTWIINSDQLLKVPYYAKFMSVIFSSRLSWTPQKWEKSPLILSLAPPFSL